MFINDYKSIDELLPAAAKGSELHQVNVVHSDEPGRPLHHKRFCNEIGINLIRLGFADIVFSHGCGLDRVDDTDLVAILHKITNKIVAVVSR